MGRNRPKAGAGAVAVEQAPSNIFAPTPNYPPVGLPTAEGTSDGTQTAGFYAAEAFRERFGGFPIGINTPVEMEEKLGPSELDKTFRMRTYTGEIVIPPVRTTTFDARPASVDDITWSNGIQQNGRTRSTNTLDVYGTVTMLASLDKRFGDLITRPTLQSYNPNTSVLRQLSLDLASAIHLDGTVNQARLKEIAQQYQSPASKKALKQEMTHLARAISYYADEYGTANRFANRNRSRLKDDAKKVRAISLESMIDGLFE